jgi:hypothetical protein
MIAQLVVTVCCLPVIVFADPYLVCDRPFVVDEVVKYVVYGLGDSPVESPLSDDPDYGLKLSLKGLASGSYTVTARACNEHYCSDLSAPFFFVLKSPPGNPANIMIKVK